MTSVHFRVLLPVTVIHDNWFYSFDFELNFFLISGFFLGCSCLEITPDFGDIWFLNVRTCIINPVDAGSSDWFLIGQNKIGFMFWLIIGIMPMMDMIGSMEFYCVHVVETILSWPRCHMLLGRLMNFLEQELAMVVHPHIVVCTRVGSKWGNSSPLVWWSKLFSLLRASGDDTSHSMVLLSRGSLRWHQFCSRADTLSQ